MKRFIPIKDHARDSKMAAEMRSILIAAIAVWMSSSCIMGATQNTTIEVRVLNQTQVEGVSGAILLVNPGINGRSKAFIADEQGFARIPYLHCSPCVITAIDPTGLFISRSTEFDGHSASIKLILPIRPHYEMVGTPGAVPISMVVTNSDGTLMVNSKVIIHPQEIVLTPESNWFWTATTDSKGQIKDELPPGEYILAKFENGKVWETPFSVAPEIEQKCAYAKETCINSLAKKSKTKKSINVILLEHNND
jgi:hypothetical protein